MKKLLLFLLLLPSLFLYSQFQVHGIISSSDNEPLAGASVLIKGTMEGTVTNANGEYTIEAPGPDAVLLFSYLGYTSEEIPVNNMHEINVQLMPSMESLDEIVVIGYGVQKKKLSTGATAHVDDKSIEKMHSLRVEQAILGQSSGIQVSSNSGQPGEPLKVRIRGTGTVGDSDPLYVIDGVPTDDVRYLSPSDIESIDILKDAASAAIYGARAANGVVLITTKKGEAGDMRITYDGYYGIQNPQKNLTLLNGTEYLTLMNEAAINEDDPAPYTQAQIDATGTGTNWMDYLFNENAPMQSHTIGLSGGSEMSSFSSSISYLTQNGIIGIEDKSQYERLSFRLNSNHKLYNGIVTVGENFVYSTAEINGIGVGEKYLNVVRSFINASPTFPAYDNTQEDGFGVSWINDNEANPVARMYYQNFKKDKEIKLVGNLYAEINFLKNFTFRSDIGIISSLIDNNEYKPQFYLTQDVQNEFSEAIQKMERRSQYNWENYLTYTNTFGKHTLNVLAGNTLQEDWKIHVQGTKKGLIIDDFDYAILDNGTDEETQVTEGNKILNRLVSFYGRLNYNFDEKYLFTGTLRMDGSTKFGPDNRFGTFPSVSAGWVITRENFMKIPWLNFFKVRASWGQNGNDKIGEFKYEATIQSTYRAYYFGTDDVMFVGSSPEKIHNSELKWETSEQTNIGFDSRFLENFIMSFDYYIKTTKDWLIIAPVPDLAGTDAPTINGGNVKNQGIEVLLGFQKSKGTFRFDVNANISYNKNEVTQINNPEGVIHGETDILFHGHSEVYRAEVGYPIGYFYGYETNGIFQNEQEIDDYSFEGERIQLFAEPGDVKFVDLNNDGAITPADQTMIGNPHPDIMYGLSFNAQYKGFDFSVFFQGVMGNEILYGPRVNERPFPNYTSDILDRWHGEGTSDKIPRVTNGSERNQNYRRISDLYVEKGDYLRLRSINLGYDFKNILFKNSTLGQLRLYISALNLFTLTKYPGLDPDVGYGDYDIERYENFSTGIDIGYYPTPRTYLMGLNITF